MTSTLRIGLVVPLSLILAILFAESPRRPQQALADAPKPRAGEPPMPLSQRLREREREALKKPHIPSVEGIESMTADAYSHVLGPIVKDLAQFQIPSARYAELLNHFRQAELDTNPKQEEGELGSIRIALTGGTSRRICWFWVGHKGRMHFSYAGIRYVTVGTTFDEDETLEFDGRIRQIHKELEDARSAQPSIGSRKAN